MIRQICKILLLYISVLQTDQLKKCKIICVTSFCLEITIYFLVVIDGYILYPIFRFGKFLIISNIDRKMYNIILWAGAIRQPVPQYRSVK